MIRIRRSRVPEPEILTKRDSDGKTETERAIEWYAAEPERKDSFDFKIYKHETVKKALGDLFYGKCAYCESKVKATQPPDIEHFRPKSAVKIGGALERPGYYWLAADWDNLLPSCIDCNRERKQELPDSTIKVAGKANWFPVQGVRVKKHTHNVHQEERRLLIHPCRDHPEAHLAFTAEGVAQGLSQKGKCSIEVFALDRSGLVDERRDHWKQVEAQARRVMKELRRLAQGDTPDQRDDLSFEMEELYLFAGEDKEYAGLARQVIVRALLEYLDFAQANLSPDQQTFVARTIRDLDWRR